MKKLITIDWELVKCLECKIAPEIRESIKTYSHIETVHHEPTPEDIYYNRDYEPWDEHVSVSSANTVYTVICPVCGKHVTIEDTNLHWKTDENLADAWNDLNKCKTILDITKLYTFNEIHFLMYYNHIKSARRKSWRNTTADLGWGWYNIDRKLRKEDMMDKRDWVITNLVHQEIETRYPFEEQVAEHADYCGLYTTMTKSKVE